MEHKRRSREDWLRAARCALLEGGPGAVRVEAIARGLKVTKGSFYWHFRDRKALLEALLREWEEEKSLLFELLRRGSPQQDLGRFFAELQRRVLLSERGEWPSDAAIFAWASVSPEVARRANREERERIELLKRWTGRPDLAEYFYMAYLGFLLRRRRVPAAARHFHTLAKVSTHLLLAAPAGEKRARRTR
jgi:AcrR family transcriptional regulator